MTVPPFELPVIERRGPWGYLLLFGLFTLLIAGAVGMYFGRDPNETLLKTIVNQNRVTSGVQFPGSDSIDEDVKALDSTRKGDSTKTAFFVAVQYELGKPIDPYDLQVLASSPSQQHQAIGEIYGPSAVRKEDIPRIRRTLEGKGSFLYELAIRRAREESGDLVPTVSSTTQPGDEQKVAMGLTFILLLLGGVALLIGYAVARAQGKLKPLGSPAGRPSGADGDRYALRAAQLTLFFILPSFLFIPLPLSETAQQVGAFAIMLVSAVVLSTMRVGGKRLNLRRIGLTTESLGKNIAWGIGAALANLPIVFLLAAITMPIMRSLPPPEHPIQLDLEDSVGFARQLIAFGGAVIVAPLWEEFVFRGHILPSFTTLFRSPFMGIFLSSFIFAAIHPQGIPVWPMLTLVGAAGAILTFQTRSLVPSIAMHATHNLIILLINVLFL